VDLLGIRLGREAGFSPFAFAQQVQRPPALEARFLLQKEQNLRPSVEPLVLVQDFEHIFQPVQHLPVLILDLPGCQPCKPFIPFFLLPVLPAAATHRLLTTCAAVATPAMSLLRPLEIRNPVPEPLGVEIRTTCGCMSSTACAHWIWVAAGAGGGGADGTRLECCMSGLRLLNGLGCSRCRRRRRIRDE